MQNNVNVQNVKINSALLTIGVFTIIDRIFWKIRKRNLNHQIV